MNSLLYRALNAFCGFAADAVRPEENRRNRPRFLLSPSQESANDLRRSGYNHLRHFIVLPSRNHPRWLLPIDSRIGLLASTQIYLPHKWLARGMKELVIQLINVGWCGRFFSRVTVASQDPLPLEQIVHAVIGESRPLFALSVGTRPPVCKLTAQIMDGLGRIIGYAKLPLTTLAAQRVRNEAAALEELNHFASLRPHIPRPLYVGKCSDAYAFVQSPLEGERGPVDLNGMHQQFLDSLWNVRRLTKPVQCLIARVAARWEQAAPSLGTQWGELAREVLRYATSTLGTSTMPFGAMHGDFAPWNTRVKQGNLLSFDWESADWEAPALWDTFHFRVLTACSFKQSQRDFKFIQTSPDDVLFMLYVLNSVCQLLEEGNLSGISLRKPLLATQLRQSHNICGDLPRPTYASAH
jgi:hypothetical protein